MTRTLRLAALLLALAAAAPLRSLSAEPVEWQQQPQAACTFSATLINTTTGQPLTGATVTVVETGATTRSDAAGRYIVPLPGKGAWHIRASLAGFEPLLRRVEVGANCAQISSTIVPAPIPAAPSATPAAAGQRLSGTLTVEGRPAPAGTEVRAEQDGRPCGSSRTTEPGRYSLTAACPRPGAELRLTVTPPFGSGWPALALAYQPGTTSERALAVDLRALAPAAENVPWNGAWWSSGQVAVGICGPMSEEAEKAAAQGFRHWRDAARNSGLKLTVVADGDTACADAPDKPGIGFYQDTLEQPNAIAGAISLDAALRPCSPAAPCWAYKSVVIINPKVFPRIGEADKANVLAHELGHALGLSHALRCTGGTIMWKDTECRHPLTHVGADDIASLNHKVDAAGGAETISLAAGDDSLDDTALIARLRGPAIIRAPETPDLRAAIDWLYTDGHDHHE